MYFAPPNFGKKNIALEQNEDALVLPPLVSKGVFEEPGVPKTSCFRDLLLRLYPPGVEPRSIGLEEGEGEGE